MQSKGNNCHMLNQAMMLNITSIVSHKSGGLFRISGLNPSTSITHRVGRLRWPPLCHIPACHLFVSGQHSVPWAFLAYWHPAAEYSTHNALQQAPVFIAKPRHVISFDAQLVFLLFQWESHCIARVVQCMFVCVYIYVCSGGGLVNSNEEPWVSVIFHFAGLIVCWIILFL